MGRGRRFPVGPLVLWVFACCLVAAGCTATVHGQAGSAAGVTAGSASPATGGGRRHAVFRGVIQQVAVSGPAGSSATFGLAQRQAADTRQQQQVLAALTCAPGRPDPIADQDDPTKPLITCDQQGTSKFILGPVFLDGTEISGATAAQDPNGGGYVVNLTFTSAGAHTWATYTAQNVGKQAAFVVDAQVVSAPTIDQAILGGNTQISGRFTRQQAEQLATTLSDR